MFATYYSIKTSGYRSVIGPHGHRRELVLPTEGRKKSIKSLKEFKDPERRNQYQKVPNYWYWSISLLLFILITIMRGIINILKKI
jgi:hypothetical protein